MINHLSRRELEVLHLIAYEHSTVGIAQELQISYNTALTHRKNLLHKVGAKNSAGLIVKGFLFGLLEPAKFEIA